MRIDQVSTLDLGGGAERVAWLLHQAYRRRGHAAHLWVGTRRSAEPGIMPLPHARYAASGWRRFWWRVMEAAQLAGNPQPLAGKLWRLARSLAEPRSWADWRAGREDDHWPGTQVLLEAGPEPAVLHAHNLHGGYFDLRRLPALSRARPVVLTLHDLWPLTGHCAHPLACRRWEHGCGHCPDLHRYPAVRRDATAENWRRKQDLWTRSRVYVSAPSQWLLDHLGHSMLAPAIAEQRLIPNGVDRRVFRPDSQAAARAALGLPAAAAVLLFVASGGRANAYKDYATMREAIAQLGRQDWPRPVIFLGLGAAGPAEQVGTLQIRYAPFEPNPARVARYYQAADLYVHAARADTFPNVILEALACGLPVAATAVGGIPEQVADGQTGRLTPAGAPQPLADAIAALLLDEPRRQAMGQAAAAGAGFDIERQAETFLEWYAGLSADWRAWRKTVDERMD